jgi:P-type Mg2+ transporter
MAGSEEGLSSVEAARSLAAYGPNEPVPVRRPSAVVQLSRLFANTLVIILLVASVIAGSLGQHIDALIIVTMVVLGVSINFWQSYRSQQAAERLRSSVIPTATVLRDGAWLETPLRASAGDCGCGRWRGAADCQPAHARITSASETGTASSHST